MKKHPFVVCSFLMIVAAVLFGTQPAWSQGSDLQFNSDLGSDLNPDKTSDQPSDQPPDESTDQPSDQIPDQTSDQIPDVSDEQPAADDESAVTTDESAPEPEGKGAEDSSIPGGEPISGGKSIVPSDEGTFEPGEVEVEGPGGKMEAPAGVRKETVPSAAAGQTPGEVAMENPRETGETVRYTVRQGDTLWDITQSVWNNPFLWPKVWKNNPYILNPDLIYPGNLLEFPRDLAEPVEQAEAPAPVPTPAMEPEPAEEPVPPPMEEAEAAPPEAEETAMVEAPAEPPKKAPDLAKLASNGFILRGDEPHGTVVGGTDKRVLYGKHDIVYIRPEKDAEVSEGDRMIISRKVRKVYHPRTKAYLGDLVHVLGIAEIVESKQDIKTAKVIESYDSITENDSVVPYQRLESGIAASQNARFEGQPPGDRGYIVDVKEGHFTNAFPDVVYLDRGLKDGLEKGNRFDVIRIGSETRPWRKIGRVEVLMALDGTATAQVIQSTDAIQKGDQYQPVP